MIFGLAKRLQKWQQDIKMIETYKAESYARGADETASRFVKQQQEMAAKVEALIQQNISTEERLRSVYETRVKKLEEMYEMKAAAMRQSLEEERERLIRRQQALAKKFAAFDEVWVCMFQHSNMIIEEHDKILLSAGRIKASKNVLLGFKKQAEDILEESAPLLSLEMTNSKTDTPFSEEPAPDGKSTEEKPRTSN